MKKGDILLIKYKLDPIGWIIRKVTHSQWNHVAWAINDHELIELKAIGKKRTPLKKYMDKFFYNYKLVRIYDDWESQTNRAIEKAKKAQFNYSYSSAIINFILIKLRLKKKLPRLSCSSFVAHYLSQEGFYFNGKNTWYIIPKDIANSKKVKDVSNELLCLKSVYNKEKMDTI